MILKRFSLGAAALCLGRRSALAGADFEHRMSHVTRQAHPINVNACNPKRNVSYMASGLHSRRYYPDTAAVRIGAGRQSTVRCYYQYPVPDIRRSESTTSNATNVVMKDIEFGLIVHGNLVAEVRDVGTFSPGAEIKHEFGLSPNVFPHPDELRQVRSAEDHVCGRNQMEESALAGVKRSHLRQASLLSNLNDAAARSAGSGFCDLPEPDARGQPKMAFSRGRGINKKYDCSRCFCRTSAR